MSDKYSRPISTRLLLVALFSLGLIYGVSHIPTLGQEDHAHEHQDAHGEEMNSDDSSH